MGKRKTFGKVTQYDLLDWVKESEYDIRVIEYSDEYLYGIVKVNGKKRQIRLIEAADVFQIDDGNFDRWANSSGAEVRFPYTQDQFNKRLEILLSTN